LSAEGVVAACVVAAAGSAALAFVAGGGMFVETLLVSAAAPAGGLVAAPSEPALQPASAKDEAMHSIAANVTSSSVPSFNDFISRSPFVMVPKYLDSTTRSHRVELT
jgi:hypothetical protein